MKSTVRRGLALALCVLTLLASVSVCAFAAGKTPIARCKIAVASPVVYAGKTCKPAVTVKDRAGKLLEKGTDYKLTYANNKKIGVATVTVRAAKGSAFTGEKTLKFKIIPAKVKGLSAAKVAKTAVKLSWKAVKGADGYAVYTYDKAAKTYTRVKVVKGTAATVKNLTASTRYFFAVRAYTKSGGKNFWGAYSALLKVKTAAAGRTGAYRMEKYRKIFASGTYLISCTETDAELGKVPMTIAVRGSDYAIDAKIKSFNVRILYLDKEKKTYLLLKDLRKYTVLDDEFTGGDLGTVTTYFSDLGAEDLNASVVRIGGKNYNCESGKLKDGTEVRYLFDGDTLVRIDTVNSDGTVESTNITKLTGDVPDSMFRIPKGYGYIDLAWLESVA